MINYFQSKEINVFSATTILAVRHKGSVAIGGDGQVSFQNTIFKGKAKKIRRIYDNKILAGFAGASADALTLFERLESELEEYNGDLIRSAVEMAKLWRTDRFLRRLEALLIAADKNNTLIISGNGDVIEPDDNIAAIGSGGSYALAAARALIKYSGLSAEEIVRESLLIASGICVFTNSNIITETL